MKVAVVTPSIGSGHLRKCVESVDKQNYDNITHYIFADGLEYFDTINKTIEGASNTRLITLEDNVGKGWYGHRVYAACSFLVNADVIVYLDEDNWIEPNHVQTIINILKETDSQWVYSLRNIYEEDGTYICKDNCESLGKWPVFFNDNVFHIDTSCFAIRRDIAVKIGHAWYGQWGADRQFFNALSTHFPNYICTNEYTVNYRLGGNEDSVKKEFFLDGNNLITQKYTGELPWTVREHLLQEGPVTLVLT